MGTSAPHHRSIQRETTRDFATQVGNAERILWDSKRISPHRLVCVTRPDPSYFGLHIDGSSTCCRDRNLCGRALRLIGSRSLRLISLMDLGIRSSFGRHGITSVSPG
jgi:hypothetical protein